MIYETQTLLTLALEDLIIYIPIGIMMYQATRMVMNLLAEKT